MKKVTAEIFFTLWVPEKQTKYFNSESEFDQFITDIKRTKDSLDCVANGVKKLWKRKGTYSDYKTPSFQPTVTKNESTAILRYSAIIN